MKSFNLSDWALEHRSLVRLGDEHDRLLDPVDSG